MKIVIDKAIPFIEGVFEPYFSEILYKDGKEIRISNPREAIANGIGYVPEDRLSEGLFLMQPISENMVISKIDQLAGALSVVDRKACDIETDQWISELAIKTTDKKMNCSSLSGGNQQKVVLAKWLVKNCDILIFDEPTRGIDVGAKSEIYHLMNELVAQGKSIIMISSEMPEVLRMSDRIVVMCEGRKTAEIDISEATQENIMHAATLR